MQIKMFQNISSMMCLTCGVQNQLILLIKYVKRRVFVFVLIVNHKMRCVY